MPTPFMHLHAAHRFLNDAAVPLAIRNRLGSPDNLGAFLLGNVAPDARVSGGISRDKTHFFEYGPRVNPHPGDAILTAYPELKNAPGQQRAFIAGYIAHLTMDVVWCVDLLFPQFYQREWAEPATRYIMLHVLLCYLDERDYRQWDVRFAEAMQAAQPGHWLAVLPDETLREWRDIVAQQICTDCHSQTLPVLGRRVTIGEAGLRAILEDEGRMQAELWQYIPPQVVAENEQKMYAAMTEWIIRYMETE